MYQAQIKIMRYLYYMHYNSFSEILKNTFNNSEILKVTVEINPINFFNQKKSISDIHRTLSNSNQMLGYKSNRQFWQENFSGGLYTFNINNEMIEITYLLNLKNEINDNIINNLRARIKKIIWSGITISKGSTEKTLKQYISNNEISGLRFIGEGHKLKNQIQTT